MVWSSAISHGVHNSSKFFDIGVLRSSFKLVVTGYLSGKLSFITSTVFFSRKSISQIAKKCNIFVFIKLLSYYFASFAMSQKPQPSGQNRQKTV